MLSDLIKKNRSYRRYYQEKRIPLSVLRDLVDLARLSPSAANLQPLKFILSVHPDWNEKIFSTLKWAAYLRDWKGPQEGEKPSAYIIILGDSKIKKTIDCDHGIAAQSILLGATERSLGGCIIASIDRDSLKSHLNLKDGYNILLVIALGYPRENVIIEEIQNDGSIQYWRDDTQVHHVPKRRLDELILYSYPEPT